MQRILVVAPNYIGDSLLTIPFLRELKKHCGRTEIDVLTQKAGLVVFPQCPYISKIYDMKNISIPDLRKNKYEKAYVLKRSFSAAVLAFLSRAKARIGFGGQFREPLLTKVVNYDKTEPRHELEHFFDVLRADYIEINNSSLEYYVDEEAKKSVLDYVGEGKKALIVACSSTSVKNWTNEGFAQVVDFLSKKGYSSCFAGLEQEKEVCDEIIDLSESHNVTNFCGKLSFKETVALIDAVDLVFGVDSGFCHLGAAFGKKVVTMFGPISVPQWKPIGEKVEVVSLDLPCSPCKKPQKCEKNYACMQEITVEKVIETLEKVLK